MTLRPHSLPLHKLSLPVEGRFLAVEGLDAEALAGLLRAHRAHRAHRESRESREHREGRDPEGVLKRNLGTLVTRVRLEGASAGPGGAGLGGAQPGASEPLELVVKEVPVPARRRWFYRLGGSSPFRREFAMVRRLEDLGVKAPRAIACSIRPRGGSEFLVTEFLAGCVPLRDLLWLGDQVIRDPEEFAALLSRVGAWLRSLHELGVWQRDMKPSNILVRAPQAGPGEVGLYLVDITAVRLLGRPLDEARRVRNLAQLLDLSAGLDGPPRIALLRGYLGAGSPHLDRWSCLVAAAIEARRDYRERQCGCRYVDEEHLRNLRDQRQGSGK